MELSDLVMQWDMTNAVQQRIPPPTPLPSYDMLRIPVLTRLDGTIPYPSSDCRMSQLLHAYPTYETYQKNAEKVSGEL